MSEFRFSTENVCKPLYGYSSVTVRSMHTLTAFLPESSLWMLKEILLTTACAHFLSISYKLTFHRKSIPNLLHQSIDAPLLVVRTLNRAGTRTVLPYYTGTLMGISCNREPSWKGLLSDCLQQMFANCSTHTALWLFYLNTHIGILTPGELFLSVLTGEISYYRPCSL